VRIGKKLYTFPVNVTTLEELFNVRFDSDSEAIDFLDSLKDKSIGQPKNAEEQVLKNAGKELYEAFFKGYTEKQWGCEANNLDPSVTARIPIRNNRNDNYLNEKIQAMPKEGYTKMFEAMLKSPLITLALNTKYNDDIRSTADRVIWTGCIDEYFDYRFGRLPYRSLMFSFVSFYGIEYVQEEGQVNYTSREVPYTRIVEMKHVTHQKCPNTTISIEYPCDGDESYYPVLSSDSLNLRSLYLKEAEREEKVYFVGRLARFEYLNMDQVVDLSLKLFTMLASS
jgi:UDP-galactopyranose mutase